MVRQANSAQKSSSSESSEDDRGAGSKQPSRGGGPVKSSHIIEEHIDVGVPRQTAYDQWTQYRELPKYSKHESAQAKREDRVSFTSKIGPSTRRWDADIVEQEPPKRIAWRSVGGAQNMGVVTFHEIDGRLTRVMVQMEYHPKGAFETVGNFFRMQRRRVRKDLKLFKHFIELRGEPTGKGAGPVEGKGLVQEADERLGERSGNGTSEQRQSAAQREAS